MTTDSFIARKVGEGYERPHAEQELPLDINYQKLVDFLVSRQKLPVDWHKRLQAIQAKAAEVLRDPAAIGALSSLDKSGADAPLDYFRCVQLRDKLAETADRTLFGGLAGAAGTLDKIVKAYEKGYVYIGEASQTLVQNVDYEIPYLKKQAAKLSQLITDAERKQAEYARNGVACAANFKQECRKLGIEGVSVRAELARLVQELPPLVERIVITLHEPLVDDALRFYHDFTAYAHSSRGTKSATTSRGAADAAGAASKIGTEDGTLLRTLAEIREGRTVPPSAHSANGGGWLAAAADKHVAINWDVGSLVNSLHDGVTLPVAKGDAEPSSIDWDFDISAAAAESAGGAPAPPGISWDIDVDEPAAAVPAAAATAASPVDVSWDIDVAGPEAAGSGSQGSVSAPVEVCWDIDMTESGASRVEGAPPTVDWDVGIAEEAGKEAPQSGAAARASAPAAAGTASYLGGCSSGDEAAVLRLVQDGEYRTALMDDLQELRAFLIQRKLALSSSSSELLASVLPETLQSVDVSASSAMLSAVNATLAAATSERLRQLLLIAHSRRYLDRLVSGLERRAGQEAKLAAAARESEARRNESKAALVVLGPKIGGLIARTRAIKAAVEQGLSPHLGGRRVNILGEINNVLSSSV